MAQPRARVLEFSVGLGTDWAATSDRGGTALADEPEMWTPEHLLLAALGRCVMTSLRHHARRAGHDVVSSAEIGGTVTRRQEDGRFAFVEVKVAVTASLDPAPAADTIGPLLAKAERDCFIGASLRSPPSYRWIVNDKEIT